VNYLATQNLPGLTLVAGGFVHAGDIVADDDITPGADILASVNVGQLLPEQPDGSFLRRRAPRGACCGG
jgi:hypothetical protein